MCENVQKEEHNYYDKKVAEKEFEWLVKLNEISSDYIMRVYNP